MVFSFLFLNGLPISILTTERELSRLGGDYIRRACMT